MFYLFTRARIYYPFIFSLPTCCKNFVKLAFLDFAKIGKRIQFDKEPFIFGQMSDDKIINLIVMLDTKCIFSLSRKKNSITFIDIVRYLQTYYAYEKKIFETDVFLKRWSNWNLLFQWSVYTLLSSCYITLVVYIYFSSQTCMYVCVIAMSLVSLCCKLLQKQKKRELLYHHETVPRKNPRLWLFKP